MHRITPYGRQLLAQASVIAEAPASSLSEQTSHSKPGDHIPVSRGASTYAQIRWTLQYGAPSQEESEQLAERIWIRARYAARPKVDCGTRDGRLQVGKEAHDGGVRIVAELYGYSLRHVYRLRAEYHAWVAGLSGDPLRFATSAPGELRPKTGLADVREAA